MLIKKEFDKIHINGLSCRCIIGTRDKERKKKQRINIDIILHCDLSRPCRSDDINDTVDYIVLEKNIIALAENSSFFLIEKLAGSIAEVCLSNKLVKKAEITVKKFRVSNFIKDASVTVVRKRSKILS
jgi:FolB domain-containing protein